MTTVQVAGVDGTRRGWVAVRLAGGRFAGARFFPDFRGVLQAFPGAAIIAVDIPIGLPARGRRRGDGEARRVLGPRRNSVFFVPPRPALEAATHDEAVRVARDMDSFVSLQVYALREKIFEVDRLASDRRIVEVHPEVSFWALNRCTPLLHRKNSWNGLMMRLELLRKAGLELPPNLEGLDDMQPDDVVDAAAAAWSALRVARGEAHSLPEPPEIGRRGRPVAIWY